MDKSDKPQAKLIINDSKPCKGLQLAISWEKGYKPQWFLGLLPEITYVSYPTKLQAWLLYRERLWIYLQKKAASIDEDSKRKTDNMGGYIDATTDRIKKIIQYKLDTLTSPKIPADKIRFLLMGAGIFSLADGAQNVSQIDGRDYQGVLMRYGDKLKQKHSKPKAKKARGDNGESGAESEAGDSEEEDDKAKQPKRPPKSKPKKKKESQTDQQRRRAEDTKKRRSGHDDDGYSGVSSADEGRGRAERVEGKSRLPHAAFAEPEDMRGHVLKEIAGSGLDDDYEEEQP